MYVPTEKNIICRPETKRMQYPVILSCLLAVSYEGEEIPDDLKDLLLRNKRKDVCMKWCQDCKVTLNWADEKTLASFKLLA